MTGPDLNDLQFFAIVVEHGGYAAAERALGIPKSRLSRRVSQLEADLGVRLLQRSTCRNPSLPCSSLAPSNTGRTPMEGIVGWRGEGRVAGG
jgi:hypothetical protein